MPAASVATPALSAVALDLSIPARKLAAQVVGLIEGRPAAELDADGEVFHLLRRQSS